MLRFIKRMSKKTGLAPGTLVHIGEKKVPKTSIKIIGYNPETVREKSAETADGCFERMENEQVTWININGIHDTRVAETVGRHFAIHPLVLEDIVHAGQRPKIDDYEDYVYLVLKMLTWDEDACEVMAEQVSIVLTRDSVVSFQETEGDVFSAVRGRIRKSVGRIRRMGPDYLCYALLDAIVDNYFVILEKIGERIEAIEDELMENPTPETLRKIHKMRGEMLFLRRAVWPLRDVVGSIERGKVSSMSDATEPFYRDLYDHTIQVIETVETCRDLVSGMLDMYMSTISNRMNEVMKVLTVIATIFIPITFIAGIYGMNFKFMPELEWRFAYPAVWIAIVVTAGVMLVYFRHKRWL